MGGSSAPDCKKNDGLEEILTPDLRRVKAMSRMLSQNGEAHTMLTHLDNTILSLLAKSALANSGTKCGKRLPF
jgi:hypothetical protein